MAETAVVGFPHEIYGEGKGWWGEKPCVYMYSTCSGCVNSEQALSSNTVSLHESPASLNPGPCCTRIRIYMYNILIFILGIYAFVILKDNVVASIKSIAEDLKAIVKKKIAAFALPNQFLVSSYLR